MLSTPTAAPPAPLPSWIRHCNEHYYLADPCSKTSINYFPQALLISMKSSFSDEDCITPLCAWGSSLHLVSSNGSLQSGSVHKQCFSHNGIQAGPNPAPFLDPLPHVMHKALQFLGQVWTHLLCYTMPHPGIRNLWARKLLLRFGRKTIPNILVPRPSLKWVILGDSADCGFEGREEEERTLQKLFVQSMGYFLLDKILCLPPQMNCCWLISARSLTCYLCFCNAKPSM